MSNHWRIAIRNTVIAALIAVAYLGFVFGKRWMAARGADRDRAKREAGELHPAYRAAELKILNFYASPGTVSRGQKTLLCYGVLNAASVSIEPGFPDAAPSLSRCLEVRPANTTVYSLAANDAAGRTAAQQVTVTVR